MNNWKALLCVAFPLIMLLLVRRWADLGMPLPDWLRRRKKPGAAKTPKGPKLDTEIGGAVLGIISVLAGVLILVCVGPEEPWVVLIALLFLLVGMVFAITSFVMIRDAVTAWRLERDRYAGRRLDQLEAEWEGGHIDAAEYKKKRKEILRGLK